MTVVSSDLAVAKTVSNATPTVTTNVTFTVTLSNAGPSNANSRQRDGCVAERIHVRQRKPDAGELQQHRRRLDGGRRQQRRDATLTITATVLAAGNYTNTASLASSTPTDPNSANNSASVVVTPVPVVNPNVNVPDVTGQTQAAATAALTAADLTLGTVTQESEPDRAGRQRHSPVSGRRRIRRSRFRRQSRWCLPVPRPADCLPTQSPLRRRSVPTEATTVAVSTAFLYTGPNPIQTGVAPDTISTKRVAVVRGRVRDAAGQPLPGVTITIQGHPEFGQTLSRADGVFDMAVNGGGLLSVNYTRDGYLPAQRQFQRPVAGLRRCR